MADKTFRISGTVMDRTTGRPIPGLRVEAWDKDLVCDDLLGTATTDDGEHFQMRFDVSDFREGTSALTG